MDNKQKVIDGDDERYYFDYKEESENAIKFLRKALLKNNIYNIYKEYFSNSNNYIMKLPNDNEITEDYFIHHEQIS